MHASLKLTLGKNSEILMHSMEFAIDLLAHTFSYVLFAVRMENAIYMGFLPSTIHTIF